MLTETIDTPDVSKEKYLDSHYLVPVKFSAVISAYNIFGV